VDSVMRVGNAIQFVSDPLENATEVSGLFSGRLAFSANKKDFDLSVSFYELTPRGEYYHLSYDWIRVSYARDRSRRTLLVPGRRTQMDFESSRLTSRIVQPGSRFVVVLGVIKQPGAQINYGTGRDVSDETIADAGDVLRIQWFGDSFVTVPVARAPAPPRDPR